MKEFRLLRADEIECRVAQIKANGLSLLLYKDARCDMNILDETVGMMNWKKEYSRENRNCTVYLWDKDKEQWIGKEDTGTESNTEQEKGLASDSFKRACFNWGIGRELYSAPFVWVPKEACNITATNGKYACYDRFKVTEISYDESERICALTIVNTKTGEIAYKYGAKKQAAEMSKTISMAKAKALKSFLEDNGIDPEFVCGLYKVKSLYDLNEGQHKNIHDHVDQVAEAYRRANP